MGLSDRIKSFFERHPRIKKSLGIACSVAAEIVKGAIPGGSVLSAGAKVIADQLDEDVEIPPEKLVEFLETAMRDSAVRDAIKDAVREGDVEVVMAITTGLSQLEAMTTEVVTETKMLKSEVTMIAKDLDIIMDMIAYFEVPDSHERIRNVWRLPSYIDDVLTIDETRSRAIKEALELIEQGENVVITGGPGVGKTVVLYELFRTVSESHNTGILWDTGGISRAHEEQGIVLFHDDMPETKELISAIAEKMAKGVVTTARAQEWDALPSDVRSCFNMVVLPKVPDKVMEEMARKHLDCQMLDYGVEVVDGIVSRAKGDPVYIRFVCEELGMKARVVGTSEVDLEHVLTAPEGMREYIADILARLLFVREGIHYSMRKGASPVIRTLLCLADMPNYETHEVHLNRILKEQEIEGESGHLYTLVKQYLSRDPQFFSVKFMHDTLADVLLARVNHPIAAIISTEAENLPIDMRQELEERALDSGWSLLKKEYDARPLDRLDQLLAYAYFAAKNFGIKHVDNDIIKLAEDHLNNPIAQALMVIVGKARALREALREIIESLDEALEGFEEMFGPLVSDEAEAILEAAEEAYENGDIDEAVGKYREAIEMEPRFSNAWYRLGHVLREEGEYEEAEEAFNKVLEIHPDSAETMVSLGLLFSDQGREYESKELYRRAIEADPYNPTSALMLSLMLRKEKDYLEAEAVCRAALEDNEESEELWYQLGRALSQQGRYSEAIKAYEKAIELDSNPAKYWEYLGDALDETGSRERAATAYRKALDRDSSDEGTWNNYGIILRKLGRYSDAEEAYRRGLEIDPEHSKLWKNYAILLRNMDRYYEAEEADEKAERYS